MQKRLLTALLVLLLIPLAFSQSIVTSEEAEITKAEISPLGEAEFDITIINTNGEDDVFILTPSDVFWSLRTEYLPDYTTGVELSAFEAYNTKIYVKPTGEIEEGIYYFELLIRSENTGTKSSQIFTIKVDPRIIDYTVTLPTKVIGTTAIDPRKTGSIKVLIENPYPVYITGAEIEATSKFLNKKTSLEIPPKSEKVIEFSLNVDKSTPKQTDDLEIVITQGENELSRTTTTIYIKEFKLPYKVEVTTAKKFLRTINTIKFTNTENTEKSQDAIFLRPKTISYISTDPESTISEFDNDKYLVWTGLALNPGEEFTVNVTEDYRQLSAFLLAILLIIVGYFIFRSPIVVTKKAIPVHKGNVGNNEIKVMLHVRNRSNKMFSRVRVLERLPRIHKIEEDFGPGTPEPKYRRHPAEGVVLDWDISLDPKEERIFVYRIKSALPIIGEFELKPCIVQFGDNNRRTSSNITKLRID